MPDRRTHLLDRMFALAEPGDSLWSELSRGPETEDTTHWRMANDAVDVELEIVYPGTAAMPTQTLRTLTLAAARAELGAIMPESDGLGWHEDHWAAIAALRAPATTMLTFVRRPGSKPQWQCTIGQYAQLTVRMGEADALSLYSVHLLGESPAYCDRWPATWHSPDDAAERTAREAEWAALAAATAHGRCRRSLVRLLQQARQPERDELAALGSLVVRALALERGTVQDPPPGPLGPHPDYPYVRTPRLPFAALAGQLQHVPGPRAEQLRQLLVALDELQRAFVQASTGNKATDSAAGTRALRAAFALEQVEDRAARLVATAGPREAE